jgi:hypothetical protein
MTDINIIEKMALLLYSGVDLNTGTVMVNVIEKMAQLSYTHINLVNGISMIYHTQKMPTEPFNSLMELN